MKFADLHTHTKLCNHASGEPSEYLAVAVAKGLAFYGVSDHFPAPAGYDAASRMMLLEYPQYRAIVENLRREAQGTGVEVLYATEFDYVPGRMREVYELLTRENFDYTIGSIHCVDGYIIDDPGDLSGWRTRGADAIWERYAELLCEFINGYRFQILGHADLPKKFGFRHSDAALIGQKMRSVFELAAAKDVCVELNTAGLRKPVKEIYPAREFLQMAFDAGARITFGSDAHAPDEVGADFAAAVALARSVGYRSAFTFREKQAIELPFD